MKFPTYRRENPKRLVVGVLPTGVDITMLSRNVRYIGSVYHKDLPSFAGKQPRPRPDASICPPKMATQQGVLQRWLEESLQRGNFGGLWENGFPRYVWRQEAGILFEARLVNVVSGVAQYKGYPLDADQSVEGMK